MSSVGEEYPKEQARLRELIGIYRDLPGGVGTFGATMIEATLREADAALASGDVVRIVQAYQAMTECQ